MAEGQKRRHRGRDWTVADISPLLLKRMRLAQADALLELLEAGKPTTVIYVRDGERLEATLTPADRR